MAEFKHGIYGDMGESVISSSKSASIYYAFLGTLPVNLIRLEKNKDGSLPKYKDMGYVNSPMKLVDSSAKSAVGYSADWKHFSLCEIIKAFFCNTKGGVGPVFAINVLDPDTDRKSEVTTKTLEIASKRIEFVSDTIILDTLELEKQVVSDGEAKTLVEGTDYKLSYNYDSNKVTIEFLAEEISGSVAASYYEVDTSFMDNDETKAERLIGSLQEDGSATGIYALRKIFNDYGVHPSVLGAPGFMHINKVYNTLVSEGKTINDKFHNVILLGKKTMDVLLKMLFLFGLKVWIQKETFITVLLLQQLNSCVLTLKTTLFRLKYTTISLLLGLQNFVLTLTQLLLLTAKNK